MVDTETLYYRLDPRNIVLLKSLLEGHEGFCVLRTFDAQAGIVQLLVSPDFREEVHLLIEGLSGQLWLEPVSDPSAPDRHP